MLNDILDRISFFHSIRDPALVHHPYIMIIMLYNCCCLNYDPYWKIYLALKVNCRK